MSEKLKLGQLAEIVSGSTPRTNEIGRAHV